MIPCEVLQRAKYGRLSKNALLCETSCVSWCSSRWWTLHTTCELIVRRGITLLARWLHISAKSISWRFQATPQTFQIHVTGVFYQFHKPSQISLWFFLSQLYMWHTSSSWYWTFTSSNFMNLPNQFHKSSKPSEFCILNFLPPCFTFFAFLFPNTWLLVTTSTYCLRFRPDIRIDLERTWCAHILCKSCVL
jgi:hypothetical protein